MVKINTAINQILKAKGKLISKNGETYKFKYKNSYIFLREDNKGTFRVGVNSTGKITRIFTQEVDLFDSVIKAINFIKKSN